MLDWAILCWTGLYSVGLGYAVLDRVILCWTGLYCVELGNTLLDWAYCLVCRLATLPQVLHSTVKTKYLY